jgi:hypothetical protein
LPRTFKKPLKKKPRKKQAPRRPRVPEKVKIKGTNPHILEGYKALDHLWSKGLKPQGLKLHFYLTWYTFANANGTLMAKLCGIHRNDIFYIFEGATGSTNTLRYRVLWEKIKTKNPKKDFFFRYAKFYDLAVGKISLSLFQHQALTNLWLIGFPWKVLRVHYVLWALRIGHNYWDISKFLGVDMRTLHRIRFEGANKKSKAWFWLKPLKPRAEDWYPYRKNW